MPRAKTPEGPPEDPAIAQKLRTLLEGEPSTSLKDAASRMSVGRQALQQLLREHGKTYRSIRLEVVVSVAKKRIGSGQPLKGVAFDLGYGSERAFARAFVKVCGQLPSTYKHENSAEK